jgi:hypothetical protein
LPCVSLESCLQLAVTHKGNRLAND